MAKKKNEAVKEEMLSEEEQQAVIDEAIVSSTTKKKSASSKKTSKKATVEKKADKEELDDILPPTKADKASIKRDKKKKEEDNEMAVESNEDIDKELGKYLSGATDKISDNLLYEDLEDEEDVEEEFTDEELEAAIEETNNSNKGKKGRNGKKTTVSEMAKSNREMITLDDVKLHFLKVGKENNGIVKQDDINKFTSHLKLSDDDFNEILVYLSDNGLSLDSDEEELDEDDLPPMYDDEDFDGEEDDDNFDPDQEEMLSAVDVKNSDPVRQYLHAIGAYQVFKSKDEEVATAQDIIQGEEALKEMEEPIKEAFEQYHASNESKDFHNFVTEVLPSTDETNDDVWVMWFENNYPMVKDPRSLYNLKTKVDAGISAKNLLIQCNLKLVVSIAKHYVNRGMDFLDLIQEGNLGLMKAVDKFDYTRGFKFSTYATWWIRQAITRALADQARTIRIPVHMVETINKITRAQRKLVQKLNRDPTAEEISEELGGQWSATRIREIQQIALDPLSLEKPVGEEEDSHVGDFIEDKDNESPYEFANRSMETERINEVLAQLTEREARVIRLRYGLEDGRTHTLEEVGKEFNVTRERIRQIEAKALKKLRHPARAKLLKDFRNDN